MKKTMIAAAMFATLLTACTMNSKMVSGSKQKITITHRHSHSHRGMPKHHDGAYHNITRMHEHTHVR